MLERVATFNVESISTASLVLEHIVLLGDKNFVLRMFIGFKVSLSNTSLNSDMSRFTAFSKK